MASEERTFWGRGGRWVLGQVVLMGLVGFLGWWQRHALPGAIWALPGWAMFAWGAAVGVAGALALGGNRTIFPAPNTRSTLVRHGVYRHIRHPLYSSLMGLAFGWSWLCGSWLAALASVGLTAFLRFKARYEEGLLRRRFPEYAEYTRVTRLFLPGLW